MDVVYVADENYTVPTYVALLSLLRNYCGCRPLRLGCCMLRSLCEGFSKAANEVVETGNTFALAAANNRRISLRRCTSSLFRACSAG